MFTRLLCLCASLLLLAPLARAALIPYYRMDSLAFLSDAVVLCEEQSVYHPVDPARRLARDNHPRALPRWCRRSRATWLRESEFAVEYDSLYSRVLPGDEGGTYRGRQGQGRAQRSSRKRCRPAARCSSCGAPPPDRRPGRWSAPSSSRVSRSTSLASFAAIPAVSF